MAGPQDAGDNADPAGQRRQWLVRTDDAARNRDHVDRREDAERIGQRQQDDGGLEDIAKLLAGHLSFSIRTATAATPARCLVAGPRHLVRLDETAASKNRRSLARCCASSLISAHTPMKRLTGCSGYRAPPSTPAH